jgi:SNF2-related domain
VILKPVRPDWYLWQDSDPDWCRANAELPGLQFVMVAGKLAVQYHTSHVPCLPEEAQVAHAAVEQAVQRSTTLPFENSGLLRPYQFADLQRLKARKGALLAYQMRLGKSALACHLHDPADGVLLVAGPLAAREAWRDWIERTTGRPPWLLYGRKHAEAQPGFGAYFCHYDVLDAHTPFLSSQVIGTLVLDELHMLQTTKVQRTNAVTSLTFRARKILGLTGTPMWNKPKSLYTSLQLLTPAAWGTGFTFKKRYCDAQPGAHGWTYEGSSNEEELAARMRTIMARRTWAEVMPELPPATRIIEPVDLTGAAYVAVESAAMKATLAHGNASQAGYVASLRRKLAEAKIKPACQIARQAAEDGHKVVLWVWHNEIGAKLTAALPAEWPAFRLQSSDPALKREAIIDAFRHTEGPAFLVASMGVGGVGLDLSCSDYAIFAELDWTPAVVSQAEMRTFHISRPHVVVYLHTDDPVETALIEALDVKNSFANAVGLGESEIIQKVLR